MKKKSFPQEIQLGVDKKCTFNDLMEMLNNNWRWQSVIAPNYACYEVLTLLPCFFFNVTPREMNHFSNCSPKCEWKSIRVPVDDMIK